jgi:LytS/YehU family sensor histidine kinase
MVRALAAPVLPAAVIYYRCLTWGRFILTSCSNRLLSVFYRFFSHRMDGHDQRVWYSQLDHKKTEQRKTEAEKLARDAELYNLRQQLQPHFLFNSLNSINALIGFKPDEARKMIHQLSDFLRGTLKRTISFWLPLTMNWHTCNLYLEIEKVRFGHRLQTEISCDDKCGDCYTAINAAAATGRKCH